tara:strand:- start:4170 stop:5270 length:1101 start_codon:yes stop_codon:yes gene_type:complete
MANQAQQMYALDLDQCVDLIAAIGHLRTVLLQGDMGNGKSSTLPTLARRLPKHTPLYFDLTTKVDAGDLAMPKFKDLDGSDYFSHATAEDLGVHLQNTPIILMLDEIGKNKSLVNPLLRLMQERKFGTYTLHPDSIVYATTNKSSEGVGDFLPPHARNRMVIVQVRKTEAMKWIEWGLDNDIDPVVLGWVKDNTQVAQTFEEVSDPQENRMIYHPKDPSRQSFWTWRSGHAASDILKQRDVLDSQTLTAALMGAVGDEAAMQLMAFVNIATQLPTLESIKKDPANALIPTSAAAICMVVYRTLSTIERDWMDAWMTYMERLDAEAQGLFANGVRSAKYSKQPIVMQNKKFTIWAAANNYMFQADVK